MKNRSTTKFDSELKLIKHYKKFPSMLPFVGRNYGKLNNKNVLVIAESHYFPPKSTIHLEAEKWYESNLNNLTEEEIYYIDTRKILETEWNTVSDVIFKEINKTLQPFINDSELRAMNYVSFMNCFQRPGKTGESISQSCNSIDVEKSYKTVSFVIKILKPEIVLFYSKFAWDNVGWKIANDEEFKNVKFEFSCHPATGGRYWHKKEYKHNANKIINFLNKELRK